MHSSLALAKLRYPDYNCWVLECTCGSREKGRECCGTSKRVFTVELMATPTEKPDYLRLSCEVQKYAWGKVGLSSEVARLKKSSEGDEFVVDEEQPYAEVRSRGT